MVIAVTAGLPVTTLQGLIDLAKQKPNELLYAANAGEPTARLQNVYYVRVYKCTARSRTGSYGYWTAPALSTARRGALTQCAIRTPRGVLCRITSCR